MTETTDVCTRCGGTDIVRRFEAGFTIAKVRLPDAVRAKCRKCRYCWLERPKKGTK